MGRSTKPAAGKGASVEQTPPFLAAKNLKDFISDELVRSMKPSSNCTDARFPKLARVYTAIQSEFSTAATCAL